MLNDPDEFRTSIKEPIERSINFLLKKEGDPEIIMCAQAIKSNLLELERIFLKRNKKL